MTFSLSVDDVPPVITFCDDFGVTIGINIGGTIVEFIEPTATDNSGVVTLQSRTREPGQFFVVGSTPVTYIFVDGSGNTETCTFNVVVTEGEFVDHIKVLDLRPPKWVVCMFYT